MWGGCIIFVLNLVGNNLLETSHKSEKVKINSDARRKISLILSVPSQIIFQTSRMSEEIIKK